VVTNSQLKEREAMAAVGQGNLDLAEQIYSDLLKDNGSAILLRKLINIVALKVLVVNALGRKSEAFLLTQKALMRFPNNAVLQELHLSLIQEKRIERTAPIIAIGAHGRGRLVLGAGTGRSGSTSLTALLKGQESSYITHEHPPRLPWDHASPRLDFHMRRFDLLLSMYSYVGDVSHWWLPHFEALQMKFNDAKAVVIKRDIHSTVSSFLSIKGGERAGAINHWINHNGDYWRKNPWDECYPKYESETLRDALYLYWEEYYSIANRLEKQFPNNLKIFALDNLSSRNGQIEIFHFLGLDETKTIDGLKSNQRSVADGSFYLQNVF
jgi:hypothetical protein